MRFRRRNGIAFRLLSLSVVLFFPSLAAADGGTMRLSEQQGNYRITLFTSPSPLRAGPADFSALVQDAATGEIVSGVQVSMSATRRDALGAVIHHAATTEAATNKLYHAATFDLPAPGRYLVEVSIDGALGGAQVHCEVEAAEPLPPWLTLMPWIGWPFLAIVFFCFHQYLVRRRARFAAAACGLNPHVPPLGHGPNPWRSP
jgi:hypothetical protein